MCYVYFYVMYFEGFCGIFSKLFNLKNFYWYCDYCFCGGIFGGIYCMKFGIVWGWWCIVDWWGYKGSVDV